MSRDDSGEIDPEQIPEPAQANAQTFLKMDQTLPEELPDDAGFAITGVPFDGGVHRQPGTRFGPVSIREASAGFYAYFYDLEGSFDNVNTGRTLDWDKINLDDCGDVTTLPSRLDLAEPIIEDNVETIAEQAFPIVLGGDHSITYPSFIGYARTVDEPVGIIHLDAHADMGDSIEGVHNHGTMFPRIHDSPWGQAENHAIIGARGYQTEGFDDRMNELGIDVSYPQDIRSQGIEECVQQAIDHATDGVDHVYLTVDIDVVDPAFAPGSGSPRPGGLTSDELLRAASTLGQTEEIGIMDLVEVNPQLDPTTTTWKGSTQQLAVETILAFIESKGEIL